MDLELQDKKALVTGSYRGTGLVIAKTLAAEGATVFVHGLHDGQADAAVAEIGDGIPVTGDITTAAGTETLIGELGEQPIDILVNNYGAADSGTWEASDSDDWIDAYQTNVLSAQRLIRHLLPAMRKAEFGRIVNLGTIGSSRPGNRNPHYYAAKGALATMTGFTRNDSDPRGPRRIDGSRPPQTLGRNLGGNRDARSRRNSDSANRTPGRGHQLDCLSSQHPFGGDPRTEHSYRWRCYRHRFVNRRNDGPYSWHILFVEQPSSSSRSSRSRSFLFCSWETVSRVRSSAGYAGKRPPRRKLQ